MKQSRIENLADGIFAIVMTLLVIDIKVPAINVSNEADLALQLFSIMPLFLSYIVSFALLYTYWRAHHFIISSYARSIDNRLSSYNAMFLFLVALVPFSSHFLGEYSIFKIPVIIFAIHIILIGLSLLRMRMYVKHSDGVENTNITVYEDNHGKARIIFPLFCALIAIFISFYSIQLALVFLTLGVLFNLSNSSTKIIFNFIRFLGIKIQG